MQERLDVDKPKSKRKFQLHILVSFVVLIFISFSGCADPQLDEIPIYDWQNAQREPLVFEDSLQLDDGLLYRKLAENGYEQIYGLAQFDLPLNGNKSEYDLILVSCEKGSEKFHLLITIHNRFNSVQDIFAINTNQYVLWDLAPSGTDEIMVSALLNAKRPDPAAKLMTIEVMTDGTMHKIEG